jgi:hypothetical protein
MAIRKTRRYFTFWWVENLVLTKPAKQSLRIRLLRPGICFCYTNLNTGEPKPPIGRKIHQEQESDSSLRSDKATVLLVRCLL